MPIGLRNNINALNAVSTLNATSRELETSLARLSSGKKLNSAADDGAGMVIADSLRSQADGIGQAIQNANDAIGIIKIADSAMEEQITIVNTIRQKAIQAAQDTQTVDSRRALQSDVTRLLEELDHIAHTTSFNGISLLSGRFQNKKFQIGAYSNETINTSISGTNSNKVGQTRFITGAEIKESSNIALKFIDVNGRDDIELESVVISSSAGTGIGVLAETINRYSNELQVRATYSVNATSERPVGPSNAKSGGTEIIGLTINGINLGNFNDIRNSDSDSKIVAAINYYSSETGIEANVDSRGHLELISTDGRGINISADKGFDLLGFDGTARRNGKLGEGKEFYGRLTLIRNNARDISVISKTQKNPTWNKDASIIGIDKAHAASSIINLRSIRSGYTTDQACAIGSYPNANVRDLPSNNIIPGETYSMGAGLTTYKGAQAVIDIADTSLQMLESIRANLGSAQIQLSATVSNLAATKVNIKFAESQIRDTDYATEIQNYKQKSALTNAGNYALVQSNTSLENIQRLLKY